MVVWREASRTTVVLPAITCTIRPVLLRQGKPPGLLAQGPTHLFWGAGKRCSWCKGPMLNRPGGVLETEKKVSEVVLLSFNALFTCRKEVK